MEEKKLCLIDTYALIYRSYYAFINTPMYNSKGFSTSTIFGFMLALDDILKKQKPTHIAAAFDASGPTFRHEIFESYKANRLATPEEIKIAVPYIKKILALMNIPSLELSGYEADDVIGTIARKASNENFKVYIITPDKDLCQVVSENVFIQRPRKSGNESELLGVEEVKKKYGIDLPNQVIDFLALLGDSSDNVPGIPGVGDKTATKLIAEYKTVENIIDKVDSIKGKIGLSIKNNIEQLILSKKLITIETAVPIEFEEEKLKISAYQTEELKALFAELNFKSLASRFFNQTEVVKRTEKYQQGDLFSSPNQNVSSELQNEISMPSIHKTINDVAHTYKLLETENEILELRDKLKSINEFCFDTETTTLSFCDGFLVGVSISFKRNEAYYIPLPTDFIEAKKRISILSEVFENKEIRKIGHNLKFDILFLNKYDIKVEGELFDTMIAHYLIQPEQSHKMDPLSEKYLNYTPIPIEDLIGKKGAGQLNMSQVDIGTVSEYACEDSDVTFQLYEIFKDEIDKLGIKELFAIECNLLKVLVSIEATGFNIDSAYLNDYSIILKEDIRKTEEEIYSLAGEKFNIGSPKQLGDILFEKLKVSETAKLTKTKQYSTNEEVLQTLVDKHPIINKILDYRSLTKLLSTYVEALPKLVNPETGKIHTTFNQTLAVTGRLSSLNPNLQNIPIRETRGREIRNAFIPSSENHILLSADYSQVELRIMAHISQDRNMIEAFQSNQDIHTSTASKVFKIPLEEVTKDLRSRAKTANFGIIYGISSFGLSQRLNIPRKEASVLIEDYFNTFPGIKKYMMDIVLFAKDKGYVETLLHRRRYLPDINSKNSFVRGMAERNAINTPIQGTAADVIKIAMVNINNAFKRENISSKMILQVHDELVFDVLKTELDKVREIVKTEMENALPMSVKLSVDTGTGKTWLEAH
jgi:DNA polymerase-1